MYTCAGKTAMRIRIAPIPGRLFPTDLTEPADIGSEVVDEIQAGDLVYFAMDPSELDASPTDFDGESLDGRLDRRKRNWIPDVELAGAE